MNNEDKQSKSRKKTTQATVLKQLNDPSLSPLRERLGIYIIAALSIVGLVLISYTGVMAFVTSGGNGTAAVDIDVDDVNNMLDDLDDLLDAIGDEETTATQDLADLHVYADPTDNRESDTEPTETQSESLPTEPDESLPDSLMTGIINADWTRFYSSPTTGASLGAFHSGEVVTILDLDSNPYWVAVEAENQWNISPVYIERHLIDVD